MTWTPAETMKALPSSSAALDANCSWDNESRREWTLPDESWDQTWARPASIRTARYLLVRFPGFASCTIRR